MKYDGYLSVRIRRVRGGYLINTMEDGRSILPETYASTAKVAYTKAQRAIREAFKRKPVKA